MTLRILLPVIPSEAFYDAVVAAGDILAEQGGTITFLFTTVRPTPGWYERLGDDHESRDDIAPEDLVDDDGTLDTWRDGMLGGLHDARDLLYERGVGEPQLNYLFQDLDEPPAQAIADEAAAGAYDLVVLSKNEILDMPDEGVLQTSDIVRAVRELREDGVRLLVT
jgi:hypothetical protein